MGAGGARHEQIFDDFVKIEPAVLVSAMGLEPMTY